MKLISTKKLSDGLKRNAKRFPLSTALLVILTVTAMVLNHNNNLDGQITFFLCFYSATAAVVALSLKLRSEQTGNSRPVLIAQVIIHALWIALAVWLSDLDRWDSTTSILAFSACLLVLLSVWVLPFFKCTNDVPMWNFIVLTIKNAAIGFAVALILVAGMDLLFASLNYLFDIDVSEKLYFDIGFISICFVAPMTFIALLPAKYTIIDATTHAGKVISGMAHYLVLPLGGLYLLTLYAYALKVLFTWQLPNGWVGILVTALMAVMLLLLFLIYPTRQQGQNKLNDLLMRWLPLAVLPLLVLMTVGLGRRIGDYGITIARLYALIFNLWCYVVCLGLFVTRTKRLRWVIASFGAGFFLFSIGPWSVSNITRRVITNDITSTLRAAGFTKFPLNKAQYQKFVDSEKTGKRQQTQSKLQYLLHNYDKSYSAELIDSTVNVWSYDTTWQAVDYDINSNMLEGKMHDIPLAGASQFTLIDTTDVEYKQNGENLTFKLSANGKTYDFSVPEATITSVKDKSITLVSQQGPVLCVNTISLNTRTLWIEGILFIKKSKNTQQ